MDKPILCVNFDGVLHSYMTPWEDAAKIPDEPVAGMMPFLIKAAEVFNVNVYSSRTHQPGGRTAMHEWLEKRALAFFAEQPWKAPDPVAPDPVEGEPAQPPTPWTPAQLVDLQKAAIFAATKLFMDDMAFPDHKPPASVSLDDRAITFTGTFPDPAELLKFKPWNRKKG